MKCDDNQGMNLHTKRTIRNYTITSLLASTATLAVLRSVDEIDWNWAFVLAPLWVPILLALVVGMAMGSGRGLDALIEQPYGYRDNGPGGVLEMEQMLADSVVVHDTAESEPVTEGVTEALVVPESLEESVGKDTTVLVVDEPGDVAPSLDEHEDASVVAPTSTQVSSPLLYAKRGEWEAYAALTDTGKVVLLHVKNLPSSVTGKISQRAQAMYNELRLQADGDGTWSGTTSDLAPTVALSAIAGKTVPNIWKPYEGDLPQSAE